MLNEALIRCSEVGRPRVPKARTHLARALEQARGSDHDASDEREHARTQQNVESEVDHGCTPHTQVLLLTPRA